MSGMKRARSQRSSYGSKRRSSSLDHEEPEPKQMKEEEEELEIRQVKVEHEELEIPLFKEEEEEESQYLRIKVEHEELEIPQIEEEEKTFTYEDRKPLAPKQETDNFLQTKGERADTHAVRVGPLEAKQTTEKNMDVHTWRHPETRCLIAAWAVDSIQHKLGGSYHNRAIFEGIAKTMGDNGYSRSWLQCQRKIKQLRQTYKKAKDNNGKSGRAKVSCPFFVELDEVLRDRPSFQPAEGEILDSEDASSVEATVDVAGEEPTSIVSAEDSDIVLEVAAPASDGRKRTAQRTTRRNRKSRCELVLDSFTKALSRCPEDPMLLQMQKAQQEHEKELFGMLMNQIAALAAAHRFPAHASPHPPCHRPVPTPQPAPAGTRPPSFEQCTERPHCSTAASPPPSGTPHS